LALGVVAAVTWPRNDASARRQRLRRLSYSLLYGELGVGTAAAVVGGIVAHPQFLYLGILLAALAVVALAVVACR
jgi:hypothetical protein